MRIAAFAAGLVVAAIAVAQDEVLVYGTIKDRISGLPLSDGSVVVASERGVRDTTVVDTSGNYEFFLKYDRLWQLRYEAPGRVTKLIAIDTRGIPAEERAGGHGMNVDVTLFGAEPGKDYSALKEPMSIARYVDSTRNIEWDLAMAERMNRRIAELLPDSMAAGSPSPPSQVSDELPADQTLDPLKLTWAVVIGGIIVAFAFRAIRGSRRDGIN